MQNKCLSKVLQGQQGKFNNQDVLSSSLNSNKKTNRTLFLRRQAITFTRKHFKNTRIPFKFQNLKSESSEKAKISEIQGSVQIFSLSDTTPLSKVETKVLSNPRPAAITQHLLCSQSIKVRKPRSQLRSQASH